MEVSGDDAMRVVDVSGLWRAAPPPPPPDGRDWRAGRWWEHGFVRRVELPEDADWRKVEAFFDAGEVRILRRWRPPLGGRRRTWAP